MFLLQIKLLLHLLLLIFLIYKVEDLDQEQEKVVLLVERLLLMLESLLEKIMFMVVHGMAKDLIHRLIVVVLFRGFLHTLVLVCHVRLMLNGQQQILTL